MIRIEALLALTGIGLGVAACSLSGSMHPMLLFPCLIVLGSGQGMFMTALTIETLNGISESQAGIAAGLLTTFQRVGNALGVAMLELPFYATLDNA